VNTRDAYADVEGVFLPIAIGVFVLVAGTILLMVVLGRRRAEPSRRANNVPLEGAIVAILALTAGALVWVSFSAEDRVGEAEGAAAVRIDVVAAKWRWRFEYPEQGVVVQGTEGEIPTLVVPVDTDVEFDARSLDVVHGFWIPHMRFQRQLFPERLARFSITFPETGRYDSARCSFFCGLRHQDMRFAVEVLEPEAFRAWAAAA